MWHRLARLCALVLCIGSLAPRTLAGARLISDARYVEGEYSLSYPSKTTGDVEGLQPSFSGAEFAGTVTFSNIESPSTDAGVTSLASQLSSFSLDRSGPIEFDTLQATGRSIGEARSEATDESGNSQTQNIMQIDFALDTPHTYSLLGVLSASEDFEGDASVSATSNVALLELSRDAGFGVSTGDDGPVDLSGMLQPGEYRLEFTAIVNASVSGIGSATANASFEQMVFDLVEIPEPASLGLLAIGAAMTQFRRRTQQ